MVNDSKNSTIKEWHVLLRFGILQTYLLLLGTNILEDLFIFMYSFNAIQEIIRMNRAPTICSP